VDLLLFYTPLGMGKLGESWSIYSYLQARATQLAAPSLMLHTLKQFCSCLTAACL
jgi:hypothetical protein